MFKFKVEGMRELERSLKRLGEVPQKHVTSSARKGMNVILHEARREAPVDEGYLKKGMILDKGERSSVKGKKVYPIIFDSRWNHVFQKKNKMGKVSGYYPVSQEYGYFAKNGRYIPGYAFIRGSLEDKAPEMERAVIDTMKQKIDAEIRKGGLHG